MSLLVSLDRETSQLELGTFDTVTLTADRLCHEGKILATHKLNRWVSENDGEPYVKLQIIGPLIVVSGAAGAKEFGPYERFTTFNGVGYVENRFFGVWDLQRRDWYVYDAGEHWQGLKIRYRRTAVGG